MNTQRITTDTHVIEVYRLVNTYYYQVFSIESYGLVYEKDFYLDKVSIEEMKKRIAS